MKTMKRISALLSLSAMLFFAACSNNDDFQPTDDDGGEQNFELNGNQDTDRVLDPSEEYVLSGTYTVQDGAKLTIPAGTIIISETGTDNYIVISKGAEIDVQGTASLPVIMRSSNGNPGDWGGLVILGDAETTEGVDAVAEVADLSMEVTIRVIVLEI